MSMRMRLSGVALAVLALLAPATFAHAEPANPLTITVDAPSVPTVYPVTDGYVDAVTISGAISAATQGRIRATVSVVVGARVLKSWILTSTGPFAFTWNGKSGTSVVAGAATILVRASQDDGSIVTASKPLTISPKKITKLTYTKVAPLVGGLGFECYDNTGLDWTDPRWSAWLLKVCPLGFGTPVSYSGKKSSGTLYVAHVLTMPSGVYHSLGPVTATVTATFSQSGSGSNSLWVCGDSGDPCATSGVRTWSGSATRSATSSLVNPASIGMTDLRWWLKIGHGHDITVKAYTVKITYYGLR